MANFTKFFRNGKTFSAYCRMRYGQSKKIWDDPTLWQKEEGGYHIAFDQEAADAKFAHKELADRRRADDDEEDRDDEKGLRQMENMAAYIHSGCGPENYYADQEAGYVE